MSQPIAILNTSILTEFGSYDYWKCPLSKAKEMLQGKEILSAVGHQATADILTELLEVEIPMNRIQFSHNVNQFALVFKLKGRPEEGKILTREEIESIGYEFGVLYRMD